MTVSVYSRTSCAPCQTLKRYLANKQVTFKEYNLDDNPSFLDEVIKMVGYPIVPVSVIDDEVVAGLNLPRLQQLLRL